MFVEWRGCLGKIKLNEFASAAYHKIIADENYFTQCTHVPIAFNVDEGNAFTHIHK